MIDEIQRRRQLCEAADTAEWEDLVPRAQVFAAQQRAFLVEHPPGLVGALWQHFANTIDRCGCRTPSHENPDCRVRLIQRLLLGDESI